MSWTRALRGLLPGSEAGGGNGSGFQRDGMLGPDPRGAPPSIGYKIERQSFDALGQRDETIRQRIGVMIDRLDDLKSLQSDFTEILSPLVQISDELSRTSMRVVELEALLAQERQSGSGHREQAAALLIRLSSAASELSDATARADRAEAGLQERDITIEELQVGYGDKTLEAENLERQLSAEFEKSKALAIENKALRAEAQSADLGLARSEHELLGARELLATFEKDNRRLQASNEEQGAQLAELSVRHGDLEASADIDRQKVRALESQLAAEYAAREREEQQYETQLSALRTERASLTMKLESSENKAASAEQMLAQARNHLREKDEAYRAADRTAKEAGIARATSDRRFEAVQADLARQTERFVELQRLRAELGSRCDMLAKALAAKDAALEQSAVRNEALSGRIEQLTSRHESARAEFETVNRRMLEDLQNERSERALMQGALEIARESRIALQKQNEALKRSGRGWREQVRDDNYFDPNDTQPDEPSNVRPFSSSVKPT